MQIKVVKRPLPYGGRRHKVGDIVDVTRAHARVLIAVGRATDVPPPEPEPGPVVDGTGDEQTAPEPRRKRRYRRRDMQAEDVVTTENVPAGGGADVVTPSADPNVIEPATEPDNK